MPDNNTISSGGSWSDSSVNNGETLGSDIDISGSTYSENWNIIISGSTHSENWNISSGGVQSGTSSSGGISSDSIAISGSTYSENWTVSSGGVQSGTSSSSGGSSNNIPFSSIDITGSTTGGTVVEPVDSGGGSAVVEPVDSGEGSAVVEPVDSGETSSGGSGNTLENVTINSGGTRKFYGITANSTIVNSGGTMIIQGGVANYTIVNSGGEMYISNGVMNSSAAVSNGGVANYTTVSSSGRMYVSSGGTANYTTVSGGKMYVSDGGVASNTIINANGDMYLKGDAVHCGSLIIMQDGGVFIYSGSVIDFTVTAQTNNTVALINYFDRIRNAANAAFTLTVNADQAVGLYALAGYAGNFDSTITVKTEQEDIGKLTLRNALAVGDNLFKLLLDDSETLTLQIKAPDIVTNSSAGGEGSFDATIASGDAILLQSSTSAYNYTDGLTATHPLDVVGNNATTTTLAGGCLYLDGNAASFSKLTLDGNVFGGADGATTEQDDAELSFSGVVFADTDRIYGGADVSGNDTAILGDITLSMDDVNGSSARVFGAGRVAGNANLAVGDIDIAVSCAEGGSLLNIFAGADVLSVFSGSITCDAVTTVIGGGEFTYCGNGSQLRGGTSSQKDSTLTVNGGTFKHYVYAGAFSMGGQATVNGDTLLTINGGTFNSHVFGGCGANDSANGAFTFVSGTAGVVVNAADDTVTFNGNLYAGSMGYGQINNGTCLTFTGAGENLSFASNSYVTGNSQMAKGAAQYVLDGDRTLAFDGFSGDFGANINNGFTRLAASGSNVAFTGNCVALGSISKWEIEAGSATAELTLDNAKNSFKGDTLTLTLAANAEPDSGGWDVITGTDTALQGWQSLASVTICGDAATYADGEWRTDSHRLFKDGNALRLAARAS